MTITDPIPVQIEVAVSDLFSGVFEINGDLELRPDGLVLHYSGTGLMGGVRYSNEVALGYDDIRDLVLKGRPWGLRIILYPKRLTAFAELPGESHDRVVLRVKRRHREQVRDAVARFREEIRDREEYDIAGIPFSLPDVGVTEVKGVLYLESETLVLEIVSGLPGVTHSRTRRVEVAIDALDGIRFETGAWRDSILLRGSRELLEAIPGHHVGELRMRTRRRHRDDASLVARVVEERRMLGG